MLDMTAPRMRGRNLFLRTQEEQMIRLIAVAAFALALTTPVQSMTVAPVHEPDGFVTTVREACGAGMHVVNGVCVRTAARRTDVRCAAGMRLVEGRCVR